MSGSSEIKHSELFILEKMIRRIRERNVASVRRILSEYPEFFHLAEDQDQRLLSLACAVGDTAIVREMVMHGARVNISDNSLPYSPISRACNGGQIEVVRMLLEYGATLPNSVVAPLMKEEISLAIHKAIWSGLRQEMRKQIRPEQYFGEIILDA